MTMWVINDTIETLTSIFINIMSSSGVPLQALSSFPLLYHLINGIISEQEQLLFLIKKLRFYSSYCSRLPQLSSSPLPPSPVFNGIWAKLERGSLETCRNYFYLIFPLCFLLVFLPHSFPFSLIPSSQVGLTIIFSLLLLLLISLMVIASIVLKFNETFSFFASVHFHIHSFSHGYLLCRNLN